MDGDLVKVSHHSMHALQAAREAGNDEVAWSVLGRWPRSRDFGETPKGSHGIDAKRRGRDEIDRTTELLDEAWELSGRRARRGGATWRRA